MSLAARLAGCALVLLAQDGGDEARVRSTLRAWAEAERAAARAAFAEPATEARARAVAERRRIELFRAWPRGARGEAWLRDIGRLRALFAGCFAYGAPELDLPGVRVAVPERYDPEHAVPAIIEVWPRTGAARFGPRLSDANALVVTTSPARLQAMVRRYQPRTAGEAFLALLVQVAMRTPAAALAGQLWATGPGAADEEAMQRGLFFLIGEVQRRFHVDRDRLIVDAAGAGCRIALRAGAVAPDRFAGLVLRAPQALPDVPVENLVGVGVLLLRRDRDEPGARALAQALAADSSFAEHDLAAVEPRELRRWQAQRRRELFRPRVSLVIPRDRLIDGWWVSEVGAGALDDELDDHARLVVSADREAARITVFAHRVESFELLLNDALIDLDRPFTLDVNGVEVVMRRSRSLALLCDLALARFDPGFLFTTSITVTVPRQG